jgi:glycosyltransferase involved in cell wall biosynthesis
VVIPLHNGGRFVAETLDSLAAQTLPLLEVIVVDDGSEDDGPAIVERHPLGPTLLCQPNRGVAMARNTGALRARSPFIAFLDQDDLWMPDRHARLVRYLEAHPDRRAIVTTERSFFLAADANPLAEMGEGLHHSADFPHCTDLRSVLESGQDDGSVPETLRTITTQELLGGTVSVTTSYVFDRELLLAVGGCATFARSLDDFWALMNLSRVTPIAAVEEPSVLYRIHPSSTTMTTSWPLPLLTSLAAARFGGNLVDLADARNPAVVSPLEDERGFWRHQLLQMAADGSVRSLLDALALIQLLACSPRDRRRATKAQLRATVRRRVKGDG